MRKITKTQIVPMLIIFIGTAFLVPVANATIPTLDGFEGGKTNLIIEEWGREIERSWEILWPF